MSHLERIGLLRTQNRGQKKHDTKNVAEKTCHVFNPSDSDGTEPKNSLKPLATSIIADGASPPGVARGDFEPRTDTKTRKKTTKQKRYTEKFKLNYEM